MISNNLDPNFTIFSDHLACMKYFALSALLSFVSVVAFAEDQHLLDAHEHGVGQLDMAFDGSQIAMEFHVPGADIVGFEYRPERADDLAAVDAAIKTLADPDRLFIFSNSAECSVISARAELEAGEGHTEFHAEYGLNCVNPDALIGLEFGYFDVFPNAKEIEVRIVTQAGASLFEVEHDDPRLDLRASF